MENKLSPLQEKVYVYLNNKTEPTSPSLIAREAGICYDSLYTTLRVLVKRGLVRRSKRLTAVKLTFYQVC